VRVRVSPFAPQNGYYFFIDEVWNMQVSLETIGAIGKRLTISIPANQLQMEINNRINDVTKNHKMDGFRPGKAPKHLVEQKFGLQIRQEAIGKLIESSLPKALQQESLEPAGRPEVEHISSFESTHIDPEANLTYVVNFEVYPEIILPNLAAMKIEKYRADVTDLDVENAITKLQNQLGTWEPVERAAKSSDKLIVNYTSTLNGKPYENNSGQEVSVELGSNTFIDGFESVLIGALKGETREADLHFPLEWRIENLAGKPVHFTIEVKEVLEKCLAARDENFAKKIGASSSDPQALHQKVREDLEKQVAFIIEEACKKSVVDEVLKSTDIAIPKALVQNEIEHLHEDLHRRMHDKAQTSCQHPGLEEEAKRRVALSLLLRQVVKLENLISSEEKVKAKISQLAASFGNAEFIESMYYKSEELLTGIRNSVLVEQAIEWILKQVSLSEKSITVEALLKLGS